MRYSDTVLRDLRTFIDLHNVSQKEISRASGIDTGSLSKILKGKGNPTLRTLDRIVDSLIIINS